MGKIIYNKGFTGLIIKKTVAPTITFIEKDSSSITVTFTNNSSQEATISYGLSSPPNDDTVLLAAGATSDNIVFSGLQDNTTYTIFASANGTPENIIESETVLSEPITTDIDPFAIFNDTSGSPGATFPINDLDGNLMADPTRGIAYYGTVSHTDLYTSSELTSEIGVTQGNLLNQSSVWHKYYWNGGIHFWRRVMRNNVHWNNIAQQGAVYGTGTTTSRKGYSGTSVIQDREVTKNGVTYAVRLMEGSTEDTSGFGLPFHGSEFNLILMNLHAATNFGFYDGGTSQGQTSTTDGVTYRDWWQTTTYTNDDFVGWKTNLGDNDFDVPPGSGNGRQKWQQETQTGDSGRRLQRGGGSLPESVFNSANLLSIFIGWCPVLTVKHPSFATYGKTGGFNQDQPDW